jgi:phosphoglycerate dehydrogenase-like enzyme
MSGDASTLGPIINEMPFLCWIHSIYAGVEHLLCPEIVNNPEIVLTNAKGVYSWSLSEYVIQACLHFAKDIPRIMKRKEEKVWDKFFVKEIKGQTMGIIGYGDIGRACARLAKAFNMEVIGLRRNPELSEHDRLIDQVSGQLLFFLVSLAV